MNNWKIMSDAEAARVILSEMIAHERNGRGYSEKASSQDSRALPLCSDVTLLCSRKE